MSNLLNNFSFIVRYYIFILKTYFIVFFSISAVEIKQVVSVLKLNKGQESLLFEKKNKEIEFEKLKG